MRINNIVRDSYVDGPGKRTVLFVQGCSIHCEGCQNKHMWNKAGGEYIDAHQAALLLLSLSPHGQITISGGEPFDQQDELAVLLTTLRQESSDVHIVVYSGYTWEEIISRYGAREVLSCIDVLVDGHYLPEHDDDFISWRGSRNQRPVNVPETLSAGRLVVCDWDNIDITVALDGTIYTPQGVEQLLSDVGDSRNTRMCGQARE